MITKARFLIIFVLTSALLLTSIPVNFLNRAGAAQFVVVVPSGPHAGRVVAIISLSSAAAQAVSEHSGALQVQPVLSVSPLTPITLDTTEGVNLGDPELTISNTGPAGSVLNWSAAGSAPWIALSQVSGTVAAGTSTAIVVGANVNVPVVLGVGSYPGTITISDPAASNSPQDINVTLNVFPRPVISASPASVTFTATQGGAPPTGQILTIANTGPTNSTLNWSAANSQPWLTLSPTSGSLASGASFNVTVGANIAGLNPGTYTDTITVSDSTASNSPQTVAVTLNIAAPPVTAYTWNVGCINGYRELGYGPSFTPSVNLTLTTTTENVGLYGNVGQNPNPTYGVLADASGTILATSTPEIVPVNYTDNVSFTWPSMPQLTASTTYEYYYIPGGGDVMSGAYPYQYQCVATFTPHL